MNSNSNKEKISNLCHEQWAGWMAYLFSKGIHNEDGSWTLPVEFVERWQRQAATPYSALSESEQDSDRHEADKFIKLFEALSTPEIKPQFTSGDQCEHGSVSRCPYGCN